MTVYWPHQTRFVCLARSVLLHPSLFGYVLCVFRSIVPSLPCAYFLSLWLSSGILWFPIVLIHIWLRSDRHSHAIFARALKPFDTIRVRCILWAFVHSLLLFWCMMLCVCVCVCTLFLFFQFNLSFWLFLCYTMQSLSFHLMRWYLVFDFHSKHIFIL